MIIKCFRCAKEIDKANEENSDYVIAPDMIAKENREVLVALKHNSQTLAKEAIGDKISDSEYDKIEVNSSSEAITLIGEDLVKVIVETKEKDIQKTGIVCNDCYKIDDFVIWGIHKEV